MAISIDLSGKLALITGASQGIGAEIADRLHEAGANVILNHPESPEGKAQADASAVADRLNERREGSAHLANADVSDLEAVQLMMKAIHSQFGPIDLLINNAAITFVGDLEIPMRRHELVMAVNLQAPFVAIREVAPIMREQGGGRIVNVSSVAALFPHPGLMSYGISKLGLERLTVDAARQLAPSAIAVNCFRIDVPVASEGFVANMPDADHSDWEPSEVAAEGLLWMATRPVTYTGHRESMRELRHREGIMPSRATRPFVGLSVTELVDGVEDLVASD